MKLKVYPLLFAFGFAIGLWWITGLVAPPVQAENTKQEASCDELLTKILARAGWDSINQPFGGCEYLGVSSNFYITAGLSIDPGDGSPYVINSCQPGSNLPCAETSIQGYPAITAISNGVGSIGWTMPRGDTEYRFFIFVGEGYDALGFAEEIINAAELELPSVDQFNPGPVDTPIGSNESDSSCAGLTPGDLRNGGLAVFKCRSLCDPDYLSDAELWQCIDQFGGQTVIPEDNSQNPGDLLPPDFPPGGEELILPEDPTISTLPISLGPLATTPLIPLAGGAMGIIIGWLVSVAVNSGTQTKSVVARPRPVTQNPTRPPATVSRQPPRVQTKLPAEAPILPNEPASPPQSDTPLSPVEHLWNLATNMVGNGSTVVGTLSEFFDFEDNAETVKQIGDAVRAWHNNPTQKAAENYVRHVGKTLNVRVKNFSDKLGNISLVMDGVDAVSAGLNNAAERGYSGDDKILAVGAELSKKVLNFALTKNPVVGLVNAAVGSATQLTLGENGRVDIGSIIDKGSEMWDTTTQEYATFTEGSYLPGDYAEEIANDATIQRKDQYLHGIRRIKQLIETGKITREEGCAQVRNLQKIQGGE